MALGVEKHIVRCENAFARSCKSKDLVRRDRLVRRRDRLPEIRRTPGFRVAEPQVLERVALRRSAEGEKLPH